MRGGTSIVGGPRGPAGPAGSSGAPGATGDNGPSGDPGVNAYSTISPGYTQPNVGADVNVRMNNNGTWTTVGQVVYVAGGGYYEVRAPAASSLVTLRNLGYSGNASPGAAISSSAQVSPAGPIGATGAAGSDATVYYPDFALIAAGLTLVESSGNYTYGYCFVANVAGKVCPSVRLRITCASNVTIRVRIRDHAHSVLETQDIAFTAGTTTQTITWASGAGAGGAHVLPQNRPYVVEYWQTAGAKYYTMAITLSTYAMPYVYFLYSGGLAIASGVYLLACRRNAGDSDCMQYGTDQVQTMLPLSIDIA